MKEFSTTKYPNGLVVHRDGKYTCQDCDRALPYCELQHLDFYSDIAWAQCKECALTKGEFCAVTQKREEPVQIAAADRRGKPTTVTNG